MPAIDTVKPQSTGETPHRKPSRVASSIALVKNSKAEGPEYRCRTFPEWFDTSGRPHDQG